MFKIESADIVDMWGSKSMHITFIDDVNFLIGVNGTGKTTVLNIIFAVLKGDIRNINKHEFRAIYINLERDSDDDYHYDTPQNIRVYVSKGYPSNKFSEAANIDNADELFYDINDDLYHVVDDESKRVIYNRTRALEDSKDKNKIEIVSPEQLNNIIGKYINIVGISTNRDRFGDSIDGEKELLSSFWKNGVAHKEIRKYRGIDEILTTQLARLKSYLIEKNNKIKEMSLIYQKNILLEMLSDSNNLMSTREIKGLAGNFNLKESTLVLFEAYKNLGVIDDTNAKHYKRKIDDNLKKVNKILIELHAKKYSGVTFEDVAVLSMYKKLNEVVELSENFNHKAETEMYSLGVFIEIINNFYNNKIVNINNSGDLQILLGSEKSIDVSELSSGEKQVLTILIEALLQRGNANVFFADEPEISLHVSWQSKIIKSIKKLNTNAQIIVATHSPEVAGSYPANIVNMEAVTQ
ncbi:AAA family ATPase [Hafnia alvei]|uniref:AAA family ATPase n=1 Tax=Hafnia alvei TaxID=569 RepID=UPI0024A9821F|nr:AAA family ATPase [Hafnia alvei]